MLNVKRILIICVALVAMLFAAACTQNQIAKEYGGTMTVQLPKGHKLVVATWKESHLWYLTRPARVGETPETLTFHENSDFGVWNGTVIFQEQ